MAHRGLGFAARYERLKEDTLAEVKASVHSVASELGSGTPQRHKYHPGTLDTFDLDMSVDLGGTGAFGFISRPGHLGDMLSDLEASQPPETRVRGLEALRALPTAEMMGNDCWQECCHLTRGCLAATEPEVVAAALEFHVRGFLRGDAKAVREHFAEMALHVSA